MANKVHKKRRHHDKKQVETIEAVEQEPQKLTREQKKRNKAKAKEEEAKREAKLKANQPPSRWERFKTYIRAVRSEMHRVVWPTRPELVNASLIVIGALLFFGIYIAIIDNIVIIPLDWISSLGA